jgi:hypothetical protein
MDTRRHVLIAAALAVGIAGACGGGGAKKYPDASVNTDGGADATGIDLGSGDTSPSEARPAPQVGAGSRLLFQDPELLLIGNGMNSCTNQVPATTDRWCGFTVPSSFLGMDDLWVINASAAARGKAISCTGGDPNCLKLTSALFVPLDMQDVRDPSLHVFDGDTLIFYADNRVAGGFTGNVYAWRPGWTQARKIAADTAVLCQGHPTAPAAYCFGNRVQTTMAPVYVSFDLTAGVLKDAEDSLLPKIETLILGVQGDVEDVRKWDASLSPAGDYIAWSARPTAMGVETLSVQKLGDPSTKKVIGDDLSRWAISPDSQKWYWLKGYNHDVDGNNAGTLQMANFPDGASPVTLAPRVGEFTASGAKGIVYRSGLTSGRGDLKIVGDRDSVEATTKVVDTGVLGIWDISNDGKTALYSKTFEGVLEPLFDLHVGSSTTEKPCVLVGTDLAARVGTFSGGTVVWAKYDDNSQRFHGYYTNLANCQSSRFSTSILSFTAIGDDGYMYLDDSRDPADSTIRATRVTGGMFQATANVIQTRGSSIFSPLLPTLPAVIYTVNVPDHKDKNGIYINTTLPFPASMTLPPPDGGTAPPDAGNGDAGDAGDAGATPADAAAESAPAPADAAGG